MYANFTRHMAHLHGASCSKQMEYLTKEDTGLEQESFFFNQQRSDINLEEAIEIIDNNRGANKLSQSNYYMLNLSPSYKELAHLESLADEVLNTREFLNEQDRAIAKDITMRQYLQLYVEEAMSNYAHNFNRDITADDLVYVAKIEQNRTYKEQDKDVRHNSEIDLFILNNPERREALEHRYKRNSNDQIIRKGMQKEGLNYHAHVIVSRYEKDGKPKEKRSFSPMSKAKKSQGLHNSKVGFERDAYNQKLQEKFDILFNYQRPIYERYEYIKKEFKQQQYKNDAVEHHLKNAVTNNVKGLLKDAGILPQQEIPTSLKELQSKVTHNVLKELHMKEIKTVAKAIKNPKQMAIEKAISAIKTGTQGLDLGL